MFKNLKRRKEVYEAWKMILSKRIAIEGYPVEQKELSSETLKAFVRLVSDTMALYINNNKMSRKTVDVLFLTKRLLSDKRCFNAIKCIDYLIAGHKVRCHKRVSKELKQKMIAHFWRIAGNYQEIILNNYKSNPMVPGQILDSNKEKE